MAPYVQIRVVGSVLECLPVLEIRFAERDRFRADELEIECLLHAMLAQSSRQLPILPCDAVMRCGNSADMSLAESFAVAILSDPFFSQTEAIEKENGLPLLLITMVG